ncbi:ph domain-containing protein [Fusarium mundagurra]|uniref:Ph domain-containing protein n=1 Tax=Fusarium mundagurra TaxID=1567541 RepID=A0A8H6DHU8_9HYPO|nr:ph domain-containing protein [Fusarium mundagurra]
MTVNETTFSRDSDKLLHVPKKFKSVASTLTASIFRNVLPGSPAPSPDRLVSIDAKNAPHNLTAQTIPAETAGDVVLPDDTQHQDAIPTPDEAEQQQEAGPFRDAVELPDTSPKIYVYPHSGSEVNDAFRSRFHEVVNLFRLNTEQHSPLKPHLEHIDYELRMCGTSILEAHPSIIVFCRPSEFGYLRSLLHSKHLKMQYCLRKSSPRYSWKTWGKSAVTQPSDTFKPLFNLYFWRAQRPRILYSHRHSMESASVLVEPAEGPCSRLTISGSVVAAPLPGGGHLTSTIGCILQVDSRFYGLTAGHLLHRERPHGTRSPQCGDSHRTVGTEYTLQGPDAASIITQVRASPSDDGSSMISGDDMAESAYTTHTSIPDSDLDHQMIDDDFVDDIDYDDLAENDLEAPRAFEGGEFQPIHSENGQARKTTIITPSSRSTMGACKVPDNDWALVALNATEPQLPNAFFYANHMSDPVFFSSTPGNLSEEEIPVFIVTANQRVLRGLLQPVPSFLGGITRKVQAEYWTVVLSRGSLLHPGDSGAIVIGADSPILVFGHVVASNPLGEVYVSPLGATMSQIAGLLETTHVSLPEPLPLLTGLASYHFRKEDEYAFELLKYLDDCIQTTQQTSDWSSLESWALCYQRVELLEAVKDSLLVAKDPIKVRLLQKFSPDHSEKVLGFDLVMSFEAESTALSTAMKSRTSTIFTEGTDDSDYEFDTPQQETITPKEPWSWPRNSLDADGFASDTIPGRSEHDFESEQTRRQSKVNDQHYVRFADESHTPEGADQADHLDENLGITQDPNEPSNRGTEPGHAVSRQRRHSIDDDRFYQHLFVSRPRLPHSYSVWATRPSYSGTNWGLGGTRAQIREETLPEYRCEIDLEGVFMHKMEIQNTIQRAEDRQWHMIYVTLHGTALNIYNVKKRWKWGRNKDGPNVNPDNPPWIDQGDLVKSYSLQYADCGIAADYKKRRYVIRLRVETDQFLISSVELSTFNAWFDGLNAAISVAAPMEDRDFPRDMSIPRIQRILWFQGQHPSPTPDLDQLSRTDSPQLSTTAGDDNVSSSSEMATTRVPDLEAGLSIPQYPSASSPTDIDPVTGKWAPEHPWTSAHDMLYAKLCYPNLLFRSPRKSNFVISNGEKWYVDWKTGRMVQTLPPAYG